MTKENMYGGTLVEKVIKRIDGLMVFKLKFSFSDGTEHVVEVKANSYDEAKTMAGQVLLPKSLACTFVVVPVIQENHYD